MLDISVIVPLYNRALTISACVESINRNKGGIKEVILVNNGSTDNSREVCNQLAAKYDNIKYYELDHPNVCDARNYGIEISTGSYFAFVDSDDTVNDEMYYNMYQDAIVNNSDIVFCRTNCVVNGVITQVIERGLADLVANKKYEYFFHAPIFIGGSSCRSLYRREAMVDVKFDNQIKFAEDKVFLIEAISKADKMSVVDYYGYNYNKFGYFIKKYHKPGTEKYILRAMEKNNMIIGKYDINLAKYNKFSTFYVLCQIIVNNPKYDRAAIKALKTPYIKELNTAENYNIYRKLQTVDISRKAWFFRHNLVWLVRLIVRVKAKLRGDKD